MARKREEESGGNWMDTYGDMVTLLFTFFVMLYSMSSVNEDKWAMLVRAFNIHGDEVVDQIVFAHSQPDGSEPFENDADANNLGDPAEKPVNSELDQLFVNIQQYVENHQMEESISISLGDLGEESGEEDESSKSSSVDAYTQTGEAPKNIYIQFKNDVLFMPDEAVIRDEAKEVIGFLGKCLKDVEPEIAMIIIKGHTAEAPASVVDSRLLSTDRAATISNVFENQYKIPSTKLYPIGLSGDYPIAPNDTEEGRSQNRRVELVIISNQSDLAKSGELLKILGASFEASSGSIKDIAGD
ncbi:MAG: flagellar motor protein MotB [Clostridium sp.]|nr:flagellar motor protein MotB [Clostridium sp.]MCM1547563.1 flagellar motor protein MotB [Ruminococcus sp.]